MPNSKEDLTIKIDGDESGFEDSLKKSAQDTKKFSSSLKISAADIQKAFAISFAGIAAGAIASFNKFKDFETGLVGVSKTTNLAGKDLEQFEKNILKISESVPESTSRLLDIAAAAGQLGIKGVENLSNFTKTIAELGKTTNIIGEEGAIQIARLLSLTGESVENVRQFGNVIVDLGNNFKTNEREILSIASEVAKSTILFKLSSAEVAGLSTALAELGVKAELGGSSIGRTFRAIDKAIGEGTGPAFEKLSELTGIAGDDLKSTFGDNAILVFQKFIEGLGNVEGGSVEVVKTLESFNLKGEEILKIIPTLATRSELLGNTLETAAKQIKGGSALADEAGQAFATTASQLQLAQNKLDGLLIILGEELAPQVIESLNEMVDLVIQNKAGLLALADAIVFAFKAVSFIINGVRDDILRLRGEEQLTSKSRQKEAKADNDFLKQKLKERGLSEKEFRDFQLKKEKERTERLKKLNKKFADDTQQIAIDDKKAKAKIAAASKKELEKIENEKLKRLVDINKERILLLTLQDEGATEEEITRKEDQITRLEEIDRLRENAESLRAKERLTKTEQEQLTHTENLIKIFESRFTSLLQEQSTFEEDSERQYDDYRKDVEGDFKENPIQIDTVLNQPEDIEGSSSIQDLDIINATIRNATIENLTGAGAAGADGGGESRFTEMRECIARGSGWDWDGQKCVPVGSTTTGGGGTGTDTPSDPSEASLRCAEQGLEYNSVSGGCCAEDEFFNGSECEKRKFTSRSFSNLNLSQSNQDLGNLISNLQNTPNNFQQNEPIQQNNLAGNTSKISVGVDITLKDDAIDVIDAKQREQKDLGTQQ